MKTKNLKIKGFSLVELLGVLAIVSAVAAVSMPVYQNYITGSKVKLMWNEALEAKIMVEKRVIKGDALSAIDYNYLSVPMTTPKSAAVDCLTVQNGEITIIGNSTQLRNLDIKLTFSPSLQNGILSWQCKYSADAAEFVRADCQIDTCAPYGPWSTPVQISASENFNYGSDPASDDSLYETECERGTPTFSSCSSCYGFTDTATTERFVQYTAIGGGIYLQQCMQRTRVAVDCSAALSHTLDPAASCQ